jgi:hypothetical protein
LNFIVLITTGQPSTNPRLVKEADALIGAGYRVIILYCYWTEWAEASDIQLMKNKKWEAILVGGSPKKNRITFILSKARHKWAKGFVSKLGFKYPLPEMATCRSFSELLKTVKKYPADLFIAHNLGALPVAYWAANYHKTKFGFDAEDYHRGQIEHTNSIDYQLVEFLEKKYLDKARYISVASPLIGKYYKAIFPHTQPVIINNVFPLSLQPPFKISKNKNSTLRIFWFSQTIGKNRGIEEAIKALGTLKGLSIELSLLGYVSKAIMEYFIEYAAKEGLNNSQVRFIPPVAPDSLIEIVSKFDIGLALEIPHCINRDICLTNKIFTYLLAGNAIIASATKAQRLFMERYPEVGKTYEIGKIEQLASSLEYFYSDRDALNACRKSAWNLGKEHLNWDKEQEVFLNMISNSLSRLSSAAR